MVNYDTIKYSDRDVGDLADPKTRDAFRQACVNADIANKQLYAAAMAERTKVFTAVKTLWGAHSTQASYFNRQNIEAPPSNFATYERTMKKFFRWERDEERRQKQRSQRAKSRMTVKELETLGFVPGKDFEKSKAISFAKQRLLKKI